MNVAPVFSHRNVSLVNCRLCLQFLRITFGRDSAGIASKSGHPAIRAVCRTFIELSPDRHMQSHVLHVLPDKRRGVDDDDGGKVEKPLRSQLCSNLRMVPIHRIHLQGLQRNNEQPRAQDPVVPLVLNPVDSTMMFSLGFASSRPVLALKPSAKRSRAHEALKGWEISPGDRM